MAHTSASLFSSFQHPHTAEIISLHEATDAAAPSAAAAAAAAPAVEGGAERAAAAAKAAAKAAKKAKKKEKKKHASNATFGYVVLGGAYVIEGILPNPHLKDSPDIQTDKAAWNACFGISTAMFLLALSVQVITWSRKLLKLLNINLDPGYASGLLKIILFVICINYVIRSQLTHLNSVTWVYIISIFVGIHGIYLFIWINIVIPARKIIKDTSTAAAATGLAAVPAAAAPSAVQAASGTNKWTVNPDGSLVPPSNGCVVILANKWRVDENGQLVLGV